MGGEIRFKGRRHLLYFKGPFYFTAYLLYRCKEHQQKFAERLTFPIKETFLS